jgi:hypothetical protein
MKNSKPTMTIEDWRERAEKFVRICMGIIGSKPDEFIVGYIDNFLPVYATPEIREDDTIVVWFISPQGKTMRIVNEVLPGVYCDHEGNVYEHDRDQVIILGTVTRVGDRPLLSIEMLKDRCR